MQLLLAFCVLSAGRPDAECSFDSHSASGRLADQTQNAAFTRILRPVGWPTRRRMQLLSAFCVQSAGRPDAECSVCSRSASSRLADQTQNAAFTRIRRPVCWPTRRRQNAAFTRILRPVGWPTRCRMQLLLAFCVRSAGRPDAECSFYSHSASSRLADRTHNAAFARVLRPVGWPTRRRMQLLFVFCVQSAGRPDAECSFYSHSASGRLADQMQNAVLTRILRPVGWPTRRGMQFLLAFCVRSAGRPDTECFIRILRPVGWPTGRRMQRLLAFCVRSAGRPDAECSFYSHSASGRLADQTQARCRVRARWPHVGCELGGRMLGVR